MSYNAPTRRPGSTNLFKNKYNSQGAPGFVSRDLEIEGIEGQFEVALWGPKIASNGSEYYSLKIKRAAQKTEWKAPNREVASAPKAQPKPDYTASRTYVGGDDDAPF